MSINANSDEEEKECDVKIYDFWIERIDGHF